MQTEEEKVAVISNFATHLVDAGVKPATIGAIGDCAECVSKLPNDDSKIGFLFLVASEYDRTNIPFIARGNISPRLLASCLISLNRELAVDTVVEMGEIFYQLNLKEQ